MIQKAINFDELFWLIREQHWTAVFLTTMYYDYDAMLEWLNKNCKARAGFHAAGFAFEDPLDALIFKLVWAAEKND